MLFEWFSTWVDGWMNGGMNEWMDGTWLSFMCNVCINILFHCTLGIQRVKGFPTPVWGTSPSTLRLRSLGINIKFKSATLPQGSSSWKWMAQVCTYAKNFTFDTIHGTFCKYLKKDSKCVQTLNNFQCSILRNYSKCKLIRSIRI